MPWATTVTAAHSRGFTLLEVLVVLVLIGIIVTFAVLSMGDAGQQQRLHDEAQRLSSLLQMARDEAILQSSEIAVSFSVHGYQFERLTEDTTKPDAKPTWQVIQDDAVFRPRKVEDPFSVSLSMDGLTVDLARADKDKPARVYVYSSGEMTPFQVTLIDTIEGIAFRINASAEGELSVEGPLHDIMYTSWRLPHARGTVLLSRVSTPSARTWRDQRSYREPACLV